MPPDVAQKIQIVQGVEPLGVIEHQRAIGGVIIGHIGGEDFLDARDVFVDLFRCQQGPLVGAKRRIADLCGAAAHQGNRFVAGFLQPAQHHDLDQRAHVQRGRGCVKADIGRDHAVRQSLVKALIIGAIGQKAAFDHHGHEFGFGVVGHCFFPAQSVGHPINMHLSKGKEMFVR